MIILKTCRRIVTIYEQKIFTNKELKRRKETVAFLLPALFTEAAASDIEVGQAMKSLSFSQQERIQKIISEPQANKA